MTKAMPFLQKYDITFLRPPTIIGTDFLFCIFRAGIAGCFFAVCICACEENEGLQRENPFAAGFPIGAQAALLAHDFALQSLMCYTFASVWRGKGVGGALCNGAECGGKRFSAAVGQAGFVT